MWFKFCRKNKLKFLYSNKIMFFTVSCKKEEISIFCEIFLHGQNFFPLAFCIFFPDFELRFSLQKHQDYQKKGKNPKCYQTTPSNPPKQASFINDKPVLRSLISMIIQHTHHFSGLSFLVHCNKNCLKLQAKFVLLQKCGPK